MYVKVVVTAGARNELVTEKGKALHLSVREPASGNRANVRVCELVAARLGVPTGHVRIINGHHSRSKLLSVRDV